MMVHTLRQQIKQRNEQKWAGVPKYIDYLLANARFDRPIAASIDIDGCILDEFSHKVMQNCVGAIKAIKNKNCAVMIITARPISIVMETIEELSGNGITPDFYDQLLLFDPNGDDDSPAENKRSHRDKIRETHDLVFAIGDRPHDLIDETEDKDGLFFNVLMESIHFV